MGIPRLDLVEQSQVTTPADFVAVFRRPKAEVRARVNWERMLAKATRVYTRVLTDRDEIGMLHTVWHVRPDGHAGICYEYGVRSVTIAEASTLPNFPRPEVSQRVALFDTMLADTAAGVLTVPALETAGGRTILLDGNHRVTALYRHGMSLALRVVSIGVFNDPLVMPNLLQEGKTGLSPAAWSRRAIANDAAISRHLKVHRML